MALESLKQNKTRTILSMLGVIIGVSTVIAVFAIGQGAQSAVDDQFAGLSAKSIIVMGMFDRRATASSKLNIEDAKVLRENASHISVATGIVQGNASVSYESEESSYTIVGTDLSFFEISNLNLSSGRIFTEEEIDGKEKMAILGNSAVEDLYEDVNNVVGSTITINGKKIEVIGVFKESGGRLGKISKDEGVYMPYSFVESSILGSKGSQTMLTLEADSVDNIEIATTEVTEILRAEHGLRDSQGDD
jgi:putative ABC transport system permease protein